MFVQQQQSEIFINAHSSRSINVLDLLSSAVSAQHVFKIGLVSSVHAGDS